MKTHILSGTFSIQSFGGSDKVHLFQQQPGLQQHLLLNSYDAKGHSPLKSEGPDKGVLPEKKKFGYVQSMAIWVVEFSNWGGLYKFRKVFA